ARTPTAEAAVDDDDARLRLPDDAPPPPPASAVLAPSWAFPASILLAPESTGDSSRPPGAGPTELQPSHRDAAAIAARLPFPAESRCFPLPGTDVSSSSRRRGAAAAAAAESDEAPGTVPLHSLLPSKDDRDTSEDD
ncbi:unnamed protein product, partial [Ectocarpus sp. 8 AP-2014]